MPLFKDFQGTRRDTSSGRHPLECPSDRLKNEIGRNRHNFTDYKIKKHSDKGSDKFNMLHFFKFSGLINNAISLKLVGWDEFFKSRRDKI